MDNSPEVSNEGEAVELSPELQSLADMANEYSDKPEVDAKSQSTEQISLSWIYILKRMALKILSVSPHLT